MTLKRHGYAALALVTAFGATPAAQAQKIYFSTRTAIMRANLDGSDVEIVIAQINVRHIALNHRQGKVYWTDQLSDTIRRANLDGSSAQVIAGDVRATDIAMDEQDGKIYWSEFGQTPGAFSGIRRANTDGSNVEDLVRIADADFLSAPFALAVDSEVGAIYWGGGVRIMSADLDGANSFELNLPFEASIVAIEIDTFGSRIYWAVQDRIFFEFGGVRRASFDGSNVEDLFSRGLASPTSLALDLPGGKLYLVIDGLVQRANLDGSQRNVLPLGLTEIAVDVALDLRPPAIPATSTWGMILMAALLLLLANRMHWPARSRELGE